MANQQVEKVDLKSLDINEQNLEKLKELFPAAFTEGKVDFKKLEQLLGEDIEKGIERYNFTWPGKSNAIKEISAPSLGTLKPDRNESVNFEDTENLFIEADNLEALKLLQKSYLGKIKMIYIDPPYNTGKDFVYKDNFGETLKDYLEFTQQKDEAGKVFTTNPDSAGRYHSNWLNMMYPRLYLARNLLSENGIIFISIDDNEVINLRKICDEIFGGNNFIATLPVVMNLKGNQDAFGFAETHEYCVVYAKTKASAEIGRFDIKDEELTTWSEDEYGLYKEADNLRATGVNAPRHKRPNLWYPIYVNPENGSFYCTEDNLPQDSKHVEVLPVNPEGEELSWYWGKPTFNASKHNLILKETKNGYQFYRKQRPQIGDLPTKKPKSFFYKADYSTSTATTMLKELMGKKVFDGPKPVPFIKDLVKIGCNSDGIVLDFFAGSGSTSHAVLELNNEDGATRKFISVQLPEPTDEKSEAFKAGYKNIAEIAKERIRRVINKTKTDASQDLGFKVLKLDKSNFNAWDGSDTGSLDEQLQLGVDRVDPKSTDEDILYEVMLKDGFMLTEKPEIKIIDGKKVYSFGDGFLLVCLEKNLNKEFIKQMAELMPKTEADTTTIFLDEGFHDNDQLLVNAVEIFKSRNEKINFRIV